METMIYIPKQRKKTLSEHVSAIKSKHPDFKANITLKSLKIRGWCQPTARSLIYRYEITYKINERPVIKIVDPTLEVHENFEKLPHVYGVDELCLYYPLYNEFTHKELITETILPWIGLWIYYYEKWAVTGVWLGGGTH